MELTTGDDWRYVPSDKNIADVVTKWGSGPPLASNSLWFNGPLFLFEAETNWPKQPRAEVDDPEEMRACMLFHEATFSSPVIDILVTSRWARLIRIAASAIRFIENCRRKKRGEPILVAEAHNSLKGLIKGNPQRVLEPLRQEELHAGEILLLKQTQHDSFPDEIKVMEGRRVSNSTASVEKSSWLYQLRPFLDADGLVRMDSRLALSEAVPVQQKFPIILPRRHDVTAMIIQDYHEKFGHANRETVFNELRQRFYIPKLRSVISSIDNENLYVMSCQ